MVGETINGVVKIRPSLLPFTWKGLTVVIFGLVVFAGSFMFQIPMPLPYSSGYVLTHIGLSLLGLGFLMIVIGIVKRNMYAYQVTDSGIIIQKQLLRRSVRRIPFASLSDVEVSQSLVGRLAGFGNVVPISKSG